MDQFCFLMDLANGEQYIEYMGEGGPNRVYYEGFENKRQQAPGK